MCCFADRKKPALIVTILSVFVFISGIIMLIESAYYLTNGDIFKADFGNLTSGLQKFRSVTGALLISFACAALIIGGLGATCGCKRCVENRCYTVWYGIVLFIIWVVFLLVGIALTGISTVSTN